MKQRKGAAKPNRDREGAAAKLPADPFENGDIIHMSRSNGRWVARFERRRATVDRVSVPSPVSAILAFTTAARRVARKQESRNS